MTDQGQVTIELIEPNPYFMIPGKLHLTEEAPGPVAVDPADFNDLEKLWITNAHNQQKIKVVKTGKYLEKPAEPIQVPGVTVPAEQAPTVAQPQSADPQRPAGTEMPTNLPSLLTRAKDILNSSASAIKAVLKDENNLLYLRTLRDMEAQRLPKPRKGVLKFLDGKLEVLQEDVAQQLGGEDIGDKQFAHGVRIDESQLEIQEDIEERTVEIRPAREEDFTDSEVVTDGS